MKRSATIANRTPSRGMPALRPSTFERDDIVAYYDACHTDYQLVWDLDRSLAMHIGHWDETTWTLRQALARQNRLLAELAAIGEADRVLDAGCGVGGSAIFLAKRFGCSVLGITLSPTQVGHARANAQKRQVSDRTEFTVMDFTNTALASGSFSVVWALESVCYAENKADFVHEASRLLEPGGRLVLADGFATKKDYSDDEQALMRKCLHNWAVVGVDSKEDFEGYMEDAGLSVLSFTDTTKAILPSTRRLAFYARVGYPFVKLASLVGLRSEAQLANTSGARYPHTMCKRNLIRYGVFVARKP